MKCSSCGNEVAAGTKFCVRCGAPMAPASNSRSGDDYSGSGRGGSDRNSSGRGGSDRGGSGRGGSGRGGSGRGGSGRGNSGRGGSDRGGYDRGRSGRGGSGRRDSDWDSTPVRTRQPRGGSGMNPTMLVIIIIVAVVAVLAIIVGVKKMGGQSGPASTVETPNPTVTKGEYYVTGVDQSLFMYSEEDKSGDLLCTLENGDAVSLIEEKANSIWEVYQEESQLTGYVDSHFLISEEDAVMDPVTAYVTLENKSNVDVYVDKSNASGVVAVLHQADEVTVLADPSGDYVYIYESASDAYGYMDSQYLTTTQPETSSKPKEPEEKEEETTDTTQRLMGSGSAPSRWDGVYYAHVDTGYLALRNAMSFETSNEIGKIQNGSSVYLIEDLGSYWYVYCPSLGMYGYTNSTYLSSTASSTTSSSASSSQQDPNVSSSVFSVSVDSGYLALRSAASYNASNEIGKLYNGDTVTVLEYTDGDYWWVYSWSLDKEGYVNKTCLTQ